MDLRYGSADENVRKRSIRDVILHERQRFEKTGLKENRNIVACKKNSCSGFPAGGQACAAQAAFMCPSRAGEVAVISALNRLAAQGIRAEIFLPVILLPPGTQEDLLRELMAQICRTAFANGLEIGEVQAEVTDAVTRPVVVGTAAGTKFPDFSELPRSSELPESPQSSESPESAQSFELPESAQSSGTASGRTVQKSVCSGSDIVLAGPVGMEGSYLLVCEQQEVLRERFPMSILTRMMGLDPELSVLRTAQRAVKSAGSLPVMVSAGGGGLFAGLWELSQKADCGLDVDLQAVPLLQETIEITDFFGINPYAMRSAGSLLIACKDSRKLIQDLEEQGQIAAVIGKLTGSKDKILRNGEDVRYLDRPQTDTLALWYKEKTNR